MARNMSFAMTTKQVAERSKTVTRRFGWWFLKPGDMVQPVEKAMGLRRGEKIKKLGGLIRIVNVRKEHLYMITNDDCIKEGFPDYTPDDFAYMMVNYYNNCDFYTQVNRIEFEYI